MRPSVLAKARTIQLEWQEVRNNVKIEVITAIGQVLHYEEKSGTNTVLYVSNIVSGTYFLELSEGTSVRTFRFWLVN